jgi:alpha-aminoadipate carrier protein LysW
MAASCPECNAAIELDGTTLMGEILVCPDCGTELEVTALAPLALALAPHEEEDWGE